MEYLENFLIEQTDNSKAVIAGFLIIVVTIILKFFFGIDFALKPISILNFSLIGIYLVIFISTILFRFIIAAWAAKISNDLNRNSFLWAIFTFIFPPLGLIIIGFFDSHIEMHIFV